MDHGTGAAKRVPSERGRLEPTRAWVAARTSGSVLEIGAGTGLNLRYYPETVDVLATDVSARSLRRARAAALAADPTGTRLRVEVADAQELPYEDASFDTVVCTFALCAVPDAERALAEMLRVARPGGRIVIADHVASESPWLRALQRLAEAVTVPLMGEHFTRRPSLVLEQLRVRLVERERVGGGLERVYAVRS